MADEIVVAVLYPSWWYGDDDGFRREVDAIAALDPRLRVVVEPYEEDHALRTARGLPDADAARSMVPPLTDAQRAALAEAEIALAIDLPFDVASVAPRLRWVQAVGAGTAQLQSAGLGAAGIALTSNGGSNAIAIAEFVIGRVLQVAKDLRELDRRQDDHRWDPVYGEQLSGQTIGLLGFGAINQAVASRARALGMEVLATRRSVPPEGHPDVDRFFPDAELHQMLTRSRWVVAAVPETDATRGLMGADAFAAMPPGSVFVNVGRGSLVDEPALIAALEGGHLRAAALDVAHAEPLPADDPLWDAPDLYLSYHCASSPAALFPNVHRVFLANLHRYLTGDELDHRVALERGY